MDKSEIRKLFQKTSPLKYTSDPTNLIEELLPLAIKYMKNVDNNPFHRNIISSEVGDLFDQEIPIDGIDLGIILNTLKNKIIPNFPTTTNKKFLAYVPSDPTPESMVGAMLTPFFNQFAGSVQGSLAGSAIESLVINWFAELLQLPKSTFGSFTMGGSGANITCIYTGLVQQTRSHGIDLKEDGLFHQKRLMIYISDQTHNAIEKAIMMLGLGKKSIRVVPSNENYEMTAKAVKYATESDIKEYGDSIIPIMIVGTAGTTNTGAIDELTGLKEVADEFGMWYHDLIFDKLF
ncbi:MAG: hypothetical protein GPJ54_00480 [Candidatus Heimdallarchaeota archaeon]|nr:hypothetical protein [Candidatus Heimdallarchaeota archaeon]